MANLEALESIRGSSLDQKTEGPKINSVAPNAMLSLRGNLIFEISKVLPEGMAGCLTGDPTELP